MKVQKAYWILALLAGMTLTALTLAWAADDFPWLPRGGCQNLVEVLNTCIGCDPKTVLTSQMTQDQWRDYFVKKQTSLKNATAEQKKRGALAGLSSNQATDLTAYLAYNMPIKKLPSDLKKIDCKDLPLDGRRYLLEKCSLCHPIGPVLTQERDVAAWKSAYAFPPHPELKLTEVELNTLIYYLANNMPIPREKIPKELQAELPGY